MNEIDKQSVNTLAQQIINAKYPLYKQLNLIREGGDLYVEMCSFIDGVRQKANDCTKYSSFVEFYFPSVGNKIK